MKVKVKKGKSGAKIASAQVAVTPTSQKKGKLIYRTTAQLNTHMLMRNGEQRPKRTRLKGAY